MDRPSVSLATIVRDEAHNLAACVGPVRHLFGEVVVGDTGSVDCTRAVAAELGCRVIDVPWTDSFAAARNAVLAAVRGAWAFHLDADNRVGPEDAAQLAALFTRLPPRIAGYAIRYWHDLGPGVDPIEHPSVRLVPAHPTIRWRYRAHEQIGPAIQEAGGEILPAGVTVRHEGNQNPATRARKLERNVRLLRLDAAERPEDPVIAFYLGRTLLGLGRADEAA